MSSNPDLARKLGSQPPLIADGRRVPDRREISLRWLSGTLLTGITSSALMGIALFAALDGREQLAIPGQAVAAVDFAGTAPVTVAKKGGRLLTPAVAAKPSDRMIMEVSTMTQEGDRQVVRLQPFAHVKMALAANHGAQSSYPPFDPLAIFSQSDGETVDHAAAGILYGAQVDSEISLLTRDFPVDGDDLVYAAEMDDVEVEEMVRNSGSVLVDSTVQIASLYYVDPRRFADDGPGLGTDFGVGLRAKVTPENVSVATIEPIGGDDVEFGEDVIPVRRAQPITDILAGAGYALEQYEHLAAFLAGQIGGSEIDAGGALRLGVEQTAEHTRIVRASIYADAEHVMTVALSDEGRFVSGDEPPGAEAVIAAIDDVPTPTSGRRDLPRIYDGIYRASLSYGLSQEMIAQMIRLLASNVDFQSKLNPADSLEVFYSAPDPDGQASEQSELLYVEARFGKEQISFYRFRSPEDGTVDFYDPDGKSVRQFLLRNPVPNGRLTSGFGMRRHPILGYRRMHTGVDWAAPRGTPIIAPGDGVVEKAGWAGGYGRQTIIRHANGYRTSYSHQSAIAKGIAPGARVRQGQVVGYVGTTGQSTGNHLHYELIVNGNKVDPMRVRLPDRKPLTGEALAAFERERRRIDDLLNSASAETEIASR